MIKSNIVAWSNVFLSREDDPRWDKRFVNQIQDETLIKDIAKRREIDDRVAHLSSKQVQILESDMRCMYASNDPCWGFSKEKDRIVCACINKNCPNIFKCNPQYSEKDAHKWTTTDEERADYGTPENQRLYYFVDLISEEEMQQYECNPLNDGLDFPIMRNPIIKDQVETQPPREYKIDPRTGRKMIVIGHEWKLDNVGSYEGEGLVPIWGYVTDVLDSKIVRRKKATRIEKDIPEKRDKTPRDEMKDFSTEPEYDQEYESYAQEYEKQVQRSIVDNIRLTKLSKDILSSPYNVILVDNPAEQAYISSMLLIYDIEHGYTPNNRVKIDVIDEFENHRYSSKIFVSSTIIDKGCTSSRLKAWKMLSEHSDKYILGIHDRKYYEFKYDAGTRWCCRNVYGVTHVVIRISDFEILKNLDDGEYTVSITRNETGYQVRGNGANIIGHLNSDFTKTLLAMKESGEIDSLPETIQGIKLIMNNNNATVLGMGKLRFVEY